MAGTPPWKIAATKTIVFEAMTMQRAAFALVPSVIVPGERCLIIDPLHVDFGGIEFGEPAPFAYDGRLIRRN